MRTRSPSLSSSAADGLPVLLEVVTVVEQQSGLARDDLVDDPADRRRDDRPGLPHGLGDRETEALSETLLDDDGRVALQRIDDRRVLVGVVHRDACEVYSLAAHRSEAACHCETHSPKHLVRLGVVGDAARLRAGKDQVRVGAVGDVFREPARTPPMSFSASQREACNTTGTSTGGGARYRASRRAV